MGLTEKAGVDDEALSAARAKRVTEILAALDLSGWVDIVEGVQSVLDVVARDGARESLLQLDHHFDTKVLELANRDAIAYAGDRAAELVGMRWENGELVPNPHAAWQITEGTREMLRGDVSEALEGGWSNDDLAAAIAKNYAFSDERSEVIARTETARADVEGNLAGWRATGQVEKKQWLAAADCCDECQEIDGETVDLDETFSTGDAGPPAHPQCRCALLPILTDEGNDA